MTRHPRERVTIDLRGIGPALLSHASARGKSAAAAVRAAVVAMLDADVGLSSACLGAKTIDRRAVKVTLRLSAAHAMSLADAARAADVPQGAYVAGLLDGLPPNPRPADHGNAVAALVDSTHKVAAMSTDLHGFIRLMGGAKSDQAEKYREGLMTLSSDLRMHLHVASRLAADLTLRKRVHDPERPTSGEAGSRR